MEIQKNKPAAAKKPANKYKKIRAKLEINQFDFWNHIGITQSGGSRYESGRKVPKPTSTMIELAYGPLGEALETLAALRRISVDDLLKGACK